MVYTTILADPSPPVTLFQTAPITAPLAGTQLVSTLQWNNLIAILDGTSLEKIPFGTATDLNAVGGTLDNVGVLISNATNPATTGTIRLGNAEVISWRNAGNTADYSLSLNVSDAFVFSGSTILNVFGLEVQSTVTLTDVIVAGFIDFQTTVASPNAVIKLYNDIYISWENNVADGVFTFGVDGFNKLVFNGIELANVQTSVPRVDIKKSGIMLRGQNTVIGNGILTSLTQTGTLANGTRDANGKWVRWTTGAAIDNQAGERMGTAADMFRRSEACYVKAKIRLVNTTLLQFFLGFIGQTGLVSADDEPLDGISGFGLCIISTSSNWQIASNDGSGNTVFADTGVAWAVTDVVTIELKADSGDTGFQWAINGGVFSSVITADVPASTTNLGYQHIITSNEAITAKAFEYAYVYAENNK